MKRTLLPAVGAAVGIALMFGAAGQASATIANCTGIYHGLGTGAEQNGTTTLPGTLVGNVQAGCQIGDIATNNVSGTGVFITGTANPSIFQFHWDGGNLVIQQRFGNNGTVPSIDVELGNSANNTTLNSNNSLPNPLASINFLQGGGGPTPFQDLWNGFLAAGFYVIDTYAGVAADDPTYQINFTPGRVPEPASLAIFGTALLGLGVIKRRRKRV